MESKGILYQNPLTGKCPYQLNFGEISPFREHWHGEMELLYVERGEVTLTADGREYHLSAREAYLVGSAVIHSLVRSAPGARLLVLEAGFPLLGADFSIFARHSFAVPHLCFEKAVPEGLEELEPLLLALSEEPVARLGIRDTENLPEYAAGRMRVSSAIYRVAALLLEHMPMESIPAERLRTMQAMQSVEVVLTYVRENYARPITVETAAALSGYEKSRFCQLFKQAVGTSFHRYLTDYRLTAAQSLLRETTLPVSAVGESVGIPQPKTFSRLVKERFGMTPVEVRRSGEGGERQVNSE